MFVANVEDILYLLVDENGNIVADSHGTRVVEEKIGKNFREGSRYLALTGNAKFAKSFVTSEYLYKIFKEGLSLDYTSVVAGYIKAVEQLCVTYLDEILLKDNSGSVFVLSNYSKGKIPPKLMNSGEIKDVFGSTYVLVKPGNEKHYIKHPTLGQMRYIFDENRQYLFETGMNDSIDVIMDCWKNFIDFDRNGFFHKDNIDDFQVVERIRNNTRLLVFWLLGSISPQKSNVDLLKILGVDDTAFDKVFKKIAYRRQYRYRIEDENGIFKAIRVPKKVQCIFDDNGHIAEGNLEFVAVDEYPADYPAYYEYLSTIKPEDILYYSKDNLPKNIILVNYDGTEEIVL